MSTAQNRQILTNLCGFAEAMNQIPYGGNSFRKLTQLLMNASVEAKQFSTTSDPARLDPLKEELMRELTTETEARMADFGPTLDGDLYYGGPNEFRELLNEAAGAIQRFVKAVREGAA